MANPEHVEILKQGVEVWNAWRRENPTVTPDLRDANLRGADLRNASLYQTFLTGADLRDADLSRADLRSTVLREAQLSGARVIEVFLSGANMRDINLTDAYLCEANLCGANLSDADLSSANLRKAILTRAKLNAANMRHAFLLGANLCQANLREADLSHTFLLDANLSRADLHSTDLSHAHIGYTFFGNVDLSNTKGLDEVVHEFESTIGIDTLYMSKGNIPHSFLRDCGVPEDLLAGMPTLLPKTIDYYSCFIGYSIKDYIFARRLHDSMRDKKLRVWYVPEDVTLKSGEKLMYQIDTAIKTHNKLIMVLSEHSIDSQWVQEEIRRAYQRGKRENRKVLFPISLMPYDELRAWSLRDEDLGIDLAKEIREFYIPDFSNWKDHDSFQAAFERLLADLRNSEQPETDA